MRGVYTEIIRDNKHLDILKKILITIKSDIVDIVNIERFHDNGEGVDRAYDVYKINLDKQIYVLKKSDTYEIAVYEKFLKGKDLPVPQLKGWTSFNNTKWLLIEYIEGSDLRNFNKEMAFQCAHSLTRISNMYWQEDSFQDNILDNRFERYWVRINKRAQCLINEPNLSKAYDVFLDRQLICPRTLCNGDFLQCNIIQKNDKAIVIDWAFAGIIPYSLDIARLIAHGSEKRFPFPFYMTDEYRSVFLKEVYDNLIYKPDYKQFIWDVILSCLNECIEFIETELKDDSLERDEIFNYYYNNAIILSEIILNGKELLLSKT